MFSANNNNNNNNNNDQDGEELVGGPIPFPQPVIRRGVMRRCNVSMLDGRISEKIVLHTESNKLYELGRVLKEAIYGQVSHAIVLNLREDGVYHRTDPSMQVAIKVYGKVKLRAMQGTTQEHPLAEISTMQFLGHHPHIMSPLECCHDNDYIYLIMEFCDGGELYDLVEENQSLSENVTKTYFKHILLGLHHLQTLGIGHRDMSLENVLLSRSTGICKIIDFGMSLRLPRHEVTGAILKIRFQGVCGKKNYIAPEVLENLYAFNPFYSDIWAAGVMLFIMLTGCPPVEYASPQDPRYRMVVRGDVGPMLEQWGIHISPAAVDLIKRILRAKPEDRLTIPEILDHPWMNGA